MFMFCNAMNTHETSCDRLSAVTSHIQKNTLTFFKIQWLTKLGDTDQLRQSAFTI